MPQFLSPGVYVTERDESTIVPSVSNNVAFFAGEFTKGPVGLPYVITTRKELIDTFGYPTDENYNQWFQASKFLDYANQLIITRAFEKWSRPEKGHEAVSDDPIDIGRYSEFVPFDETKKNEPKNGTFLIRLGNNKVNYTLPNFEIGDLVTFNTKAHGHNRDALSQITNITPVPMPDTNSDAYALVTFKPLNSDKIVYRADKEGTLWSHSYSHKNGETYALSRGEEKEVLVTLEEAKALKLVIDEKNPDVPATKTTPAKWKMKVLPGNSSHSGNIDVVADKEIFGERRLQMTYELIENDEEWDFKYIQFKTCGDSEGENPLRTFYTTKDGIDSKLKFYTRTPSTEAVTVAIANEEDFQLEYDNQGNPYNKAVAYTIINQDVVENVYLRDLFDYYPTKEEVALIIKKGDDVEAFVVSFDPDSLDGNNKSNYIEKVINEQSNLVYVLDNTSIKEMPASYLVQDRHTRTIEIENPLFHPGFDGETYSDGVAEKQEMRFSIPLNEHKKLFVEGDPTKDLLPVYASVDGKKGKVEKVGDFYVYTITGRPVIGKGGNWYKRMAPNPAIVPTKPLTVQGGKSPKVTIGSLRTAYFTVLDKEKYEIDVVIGNERLQNVAIELADTRKDCIGFVGARCEDTVGKRANDATNAVVKYITENRPNYRVAAGLGQELTRTMFGAFFGNYFRIYDTYNKKFRWINVAGDMAGIRCSITTQKDSWWVSAGLRRGVIRNIDRMAFTPSLPMRDNLYKNSINPLVTFPGTGNLVWGNKTLQSYASAFDRINVRNMFSTIERAMAKAARSQVFEFNDSFTRNAIVSMFNPYLATVKAGRGLTDFLVICDETNNTPDVISRNELRVDIYIKPNYAAEFIQLNFVNVGTRSFGEVIGA